MKKSDRILLTIALSLLMLGFACLVVYGAVNGFDSDKMFSSSDYEKKEIDLDIDNVSKITADLEVTDILITKSNNKKAHLVYYESKNEEYDITKDGDKIKIVCNYENHLEFLNINFKKKINILSLPSDYNGDLIIKTGTGDVYIRGFSALNKVDIKYSTGHCELEGVKASDINIIGSTGGCDLENISANNISVNTSTGRVETENLTIEAKLEVITTTGHQSIEGIKADSVRLSSSTGRIEVDETYADNDIVVISKTGGQYYDEVQAESISITATTAPVKIEKLSADEININTTTGSVRGSLKGRETDYSILTSTKTGSCNLDDRITDGGKVLNVKTTTGSIKITFER